MKKVKDFFIIIRGSFWEREGGGGGGGGKTIRPPFLKIVRVMVEPWNLALKYTSTYSFRKYTF